MDCGVRKLVLDVVLPDCEGPATKCEYELLHTLHEGLQTVDVRAGGAAEDAVTVLVVNSCGAYGRDPALVKPHHTIVATLHPSVTYTHSTAVRRTQYNLRAHPPTEPSRRERKVAEITCSQSAFRRLAIAIH